MTKYSIRGENTEITDAIRNYVESKLGRVEKYFHAERGLGARVSLGVYREKTAKVGVVILVDSVTLRAEDVSQDMYSSVNLVTDKIEYQVHKNKTEIARKHREKLLASQIFISEFGAEPVEEEPMIKVVRTRHISLKSMDIDEVLPQVGLLGHDFFIYTDVEDDVTNALYRREDNELGLTEAG